MWVLVDMDGLFSIVSLDSIPWTLSSHHAQYLKESTSSCLAAGLSVLEICHIDIDVIVFGWS